MKPDDRTQRYLLCLNSRKCTKTTNVISAIKSIQIKNNPTFMYTENNNNNSNKTDRLHVNTADPQIWLTFNFGSCTMFYLVCGIDD